MTTKTMIAPFSGPRFRENESKTGNPCAICGKGINAGDEWEAHVVHGGAKFAAMSEPDDHGGGDMGWWSLGNTCAKKLPSTHRRRRET